MANGTDTIIIRGGSAEVEFDIGSFDQKEPSAPHPATRKNHTTDKKKIIHVVITGDITFDSQLNSDGFNCEITCLLGNV